MHRHNIHGRHFDLRKNARGSGTVHQIGATKITGERPFPEGKEMRVQQNSSRIPRNDSRRRKNCNGPNQAWRNTRLAYLQHRETSQIFPRVWQFLQKIYSSIFRTGTTIKRLNKKDKKFEWTNECQDTFDTLKKNFTEEPVLMIPDHSRPFQIRSDASKVATGAVLTQLDSNSDRHPCSFISKTFSPTE